jgi:hypothetical protein
VLVAGGASGARDGFETVQALYDLDGQSGRVYIARRSAKNAAAAIEEIKRSVAADRTVKGKGETLFAATRLLTDLTTIKASAEEFLSKEQHFVK